MFTFHVFDGKSVIEAVAFGTMITDSLINMGIGTKIRIIGAEISWRGGMAQLRLNKGVLEFTLRFQKINRRVDNPSTSEPMLCL